MCRIRLECNISAFKAVAYSADRFLAMHDLGRLTQDHPFLDWAYVIQFVPTNEKQKGKRRGICVGFCSLFSYYKFLLKADLQITSNTHGSAISVIW
jgi:hypothetical protein